MTWLSFTIHGIWIPVRFNIHFCIQECIYDKMLWRRRRVGKTTQLIIFISFILILASVTSNSHTHMVFEDAISTSFADNVCLHISTPAAYVTVPSRSWYRLIVSWFLHGVFFSVWYKSAHDYCCFDVPRYRRKFVSLCYKWCHQIMCKSEQILFLFIFFSGWSLRMLCAYMTNAFTAAMLTKS